ncbi:MAG: DUF3418 domain-containing protein, partial [Actinobacteria bacterium]|nr:DUF3418 domain-containing protein [Actinomycetota bacterium]
DVVYRFYDTRVPEHVHSRPDFERWRREVEARDPNALRLIREHLVTETPDDAAFPRCAMRPAPRTARRSQGRREVGGWHPQ